MGFLVGVAGVGVAGLWAERVADNPHLSTSDRSMPHVAVSRTCQ